MTTVTAALFFHLLIFGTFTSDFERGVKAMEEKDYELAITCFNASIHENPNDASAFFRRGTVYLYKKQYDVAIHDLTEAIRLEPKARRSLQQPGRHIQQETQL